MTCCAAMAVTAGEIALGVARTQELKLATTIDPTGVRRLRLGVPQMHCGGCIASIEKALAALPGVMSARANLTTRSVAIAWQGSGTDAGIIHDALAAVGFDAVPLDNAAQDDAARRESRGLVTRMAVAGFASANVMLLSVSVWSGAEAATRDLLHWISALIALTDGGLCGTTILCVGLAGRAAEYECTDFVGRTAGGGDSDVVLIAARHAQRAAHQFRRCEMTVLSLLIPVALFLGLMGLCAFLWSLRSNQFDDLEGEAERILFDER